MGLQLSIGTSHLFLRNPKWPKGPSLSPPSRERERDQRASNCKQKEEFVCVCRLYAKTGIFAECIPLRVPVGSLSQKTSALFLMTFSSAIFLPSKVANPFSSFHWCLKLPGLFSFFTRKGHGHAIFLPHPSPSMLWAGGAWCQLICQYLPIPSLPQVPSHTHPPPSFTFHFILERERERSRERF